MNWTGGQLHRSARQGALSKPQKQNFAKSRQLAIDRASRQPSPFRGFPNIRKHEEQSACEDERGEQAVVTAGPVQSVLNDSTSLPRVTVSRDLALMSHEPRDTKPDESQVSGSLPTSNNHLDSLKRQLLQTSDWATISAARPLEISFAPADEIERFGKRRKLNDGDRKRLSATYGNRPPSELLKSRESDALWSTNLDQVKIRINGRPANFRAGASQEMSTNQPSSQSMLLDSEESIRCHRLGPAEDTRSHSPKRLSQQSSFGRASRGVRGPAFAPRYEGDDTDKRKMTQAFHRPQFALPSPEQPGPAFSERSVTQSPSASGSPLLRPPNFAINNAEPARPTMTTQGYNCAPTSDPFRSHMEILDAPFTLPQSDNLSNPPASSWLPQPQAPVSSSPHTIFSSAAKLRRPAAKESSYLNTPASPFATATHGSPGAKVFGQLVEIRSDDGAD